MVAMSIHTLDIRTIAFNLEDFKYGVDYYALPPYTIVVIKGSELEKIQIENEKRNNRIQFDKVN